MKALAQHYADMGVPPQLAVHRAIEELRTRVRVKARNVQFTAKHREQAANRIGIPAAWV